MARHVSATPEYPAVTKVRFGKMFPREVARGMAVASICYLPLGVLDWYGEHSAVGLDGIKAHAVCEEAAGLPSDRRGRRGLLHGGPTPGAAAVSTA